ncbi:DUF2513 domain-containing protein [Aeromonas veronii]|uniref:DUF2513 domain-containing protein n=1 Tax=Aeromonas veronii TaxID=654 RepID=UPI001F26C282|nr:DUF2513 domain-containing protein [Aeromonas veronii]
MDSLGNILVIVGIFLGKGIWMKRDWDTVRFLLTSLEALPNTDENLSLDSFEHETEEATYSTSYHMELLIEAGLAEGVMHKFLDGGPTDFSAFRLTWAGHEFLDAIRSDTVWNKTKETFTTKGLDMTFDLIKTVAGGVATSLLF